MKNNIELKFASRKQCKFAVENWHYSKRLPVGVHSSFSCYEYNKFIGVIIYSKGANCNIGKQYGLKHFEICELTRIAFDKHENNVSKYLSISLKLLKKYCPKIKLVVSYADVDHGHEGKIYQASNWIYVGLVGEETAPGFIIKGKYVHARSIHSKCFKRSIDVVKKYIDINAEKFITKGKHKYLYPLDKEIKNKIKCLSIPYPSSGDSLCSKTHDSNHEKTVQI